MSSTPPNGNGRAAQTTALVFSIISVLMNGETRLTDRTRQIEMDAAADRKSIDERLTNRMNLLDARLSDSINNEQERNNRYGDRIARMEGRLGMPIVNGNNGEHK